MKAHKFELQAFSAQADLKDRLKTLSASPGLTLLYEGLVSGVFDGAPMFTKSVKELIQKETGLIYRRGKLVCAP